ncbi:MAG: PGF-pre-PGF domain-containing protein [Candidatus Nezhaarchaeota archaeon]|nr:PGF-pre-PGF domain-containing protein [Candidatus Nezhaarchaeota archaeon]
MRGNPVLVLVLLTLALGLMVSSGSAQLRQSTQLSLAPENFTVTSGSSLTFTATLLSDGKPLAGKTIVFSATLGTVDPPIGVTDTDGKVLFVYTAPQTPVEIYVKITATFAGDLLYEGSTAVASGTIEPMPSPTLPSISLIGASFAVPEALKDDVFSYRDSIPSNIMKALPISLPSEAFLLATNESLYLVFAEQSDKGLAKVDGWLLPTHIQLAGLNIAVVVAKQVTFVKEGPLTTLSEILANPEAYKFKLVKVDAYRRQISVLYDPDEPPYIEFPLTIGYLSEEPIEPLAIVRKALERAKEITFRINDGVIRDLLELRGPQTLWVFNFEHEYWYDSKAITNGIVIPLNHSIFTLLERSMSVLGRLLKASGSIILYDVKTDLPYEGVQSVVELKKNSERYLGKVVKLTANCYGGYISVQEVIEHNTPCGEDLVYVPDVGCVNLVTDVRFEGFVAWNDVSVTPKRDELLFVVGISSFHQDEQFVKASGIFELLGKVLSTKEVSDSLPDDVALIVYSARKVGEIDFEKLAIQVKDEVKGQVGELLWNLQDIYPYQKPPEIPFKVPRKVFWPKAPISVTTPKELPEIFVDRNFTVIIDVVDVPINLNISNSIISNISVRLREIVRNVTIYFEKLVEKPPEVPSPPGLVYAYHRIDVNIPEASIEKADVTFWVMKEWLVTHGATKDDVVMLRYHGGEWLRLLTKAIGENATHSEFTAETPGFSIFAIATMMPVRIPVSLTISVEPREVTVGEEVIVKGSISPAMSKTIELTIKRPDGTTGTRTTTSTPDGSFGFRIKLDKEGEWSFTARFAGDLTYEGAVSAEVRATAKPKPGPCIIATAAFGTELDPHVQHLRGFKDNVVLRTFAGSSFMNVFNAWYYSWSPYVASAMQAYESFRQAVKYALYPLIGILRISEALYEALSFSPEAGVVAAGIISSLLIGLVYFAPPSIAVMCLAGRWPSKRATKLTALIWLAAITGTGVSIIAGSSVAAMAFTSTLVLTSLASSVVLAAQLIRRCIKC